MKHGEFIFADLSTYELKKAQQFYQNVFDWEFFSEDKQYFLAFSGKKEIMGLYETPKKFQDMKMPSFFMTYIQVQNRNQTVDLAKSLGAIIELVDDVVGFGKIALIRDPLGAGFTIYEGDKLNSRNHNISNSIVWNELFVSSLDKVKDFYQKLFAWEYEFDEKRQRLEIYVDEKNIGAIQQLDESLRGKYEYWGTFFEVENVQETIKKIKQQGGAVLIDNKDYISCTDFSGEAFFYLIQKR